MYPVFTHMPSGVTVGDSGLCSPFSSIVGGVYLVCVYSHARWSYHRRFRSLLWCPFSGDRYWLPLLFQ